MRFRAVKSGGGGIRTHGRLAPSTVFKTAPFGRSGTPPSADPSQCLRVLGDARWRSELPQHLGHFALEVLEQRQQPAVRRGRAVERVRRAERLLAAAITDPRAAGL